MIERSLCITMAAGRAGPATGVGVESGGRQSRHIHAVPWLAREMHAFTSRSHPLLRIFH
jgi:hypothetical protein